MTLRKFPVKELDAGTRAKYGDIVSEILGSVSDTDREALFGFYVDMKSEEEIEATFGISTEKFRALRRSVRSAFFEKTSLCA